MLTADPGLVDADLHGRAWIGGPRRTAAGWERAPEQTSRAVHLAAYGHAGLLRLLIEHGADVDALGYEGNHGWAPPLVLACWEGTVETVRLLLEAGADPNLPSRPGGSALHAAINHYDAEKIELLLAHGARHDLYSAAAVGDLEEVERQLAAGDGLLDRRDDLRGRTPLEWAVFNRPGEGCRAPPRSGGRGESAGPRRPGEARRGAAARRRRSGVRQPAPGPGAGTAAHARPPQPPPGDGEAAAEPRGRSRLRRLGARRRRRVPRPGRDPPLLLARAVAPVPGRGPRLRRGPHRRRRRRQRRVHPRPLAPLPLPAARTRSTWPGSS